MRTMRTTIMCLTLVTGTAPAFGDEATLARGYRACGSLSSGVEVRNCENRELDALEATLNRTMQAALVRARAYATTTNRGGEPAPELLTKSQRAWGAYRDAQCMMIADANSAGGTAFIQEIHDCRLGMVTSRIVALEALYR